MKQSRVIWGMKARVYAEMFPRGADLAAIAEEARERFLATGELTEGVQFIGRWRHSVAEEWIKTSDPGQSLQGFFEMVKQIEGRG